MWLQTKITFIKTKKIGYLFNADIWTGWLIWWFVVEECAEGEMSKALKTLLQENMSNISNNDFKQWIQERNLPALASQLLLPVSILWSHVEKYSSLFFQKSHLILLHIF